MSEKIVIHMRLGGAAKETVERVRDMCALPSNNEAVRYLMTRGIESLSGQLGNRALVERISKEFSRDELLRALQQGEEGKG